MRPVFEDERDQYIVDEDGNHIRGVWFIPRDECDVPAVVDRGPTEGESERGPTF